MSPASNPNELSCDPVVIHWVLASSYKVINGTTSLVPLIVVISESILGLVEELCNETVPPEQAPAADEDALRLLGAPMSVETTALPSAPQHALAPTDLA
jgi:hypothetical protein